MEEHHRHKRLHHPDKSAMAEHSINWGHQIQFNDTSVIAKKPGLMERITGKPTEIELRPDNMNREKGSSEQVLEATHSKHE
jgi:hypothetical protein